MIPARSVKNLHDMLVRDLRAYVMGCEADQRRTQNRMRKDRTRKQYDRTVALVASKLGITVEWYEPGWLKSRSDIEKALDAFFPGWEKESFTTLPPRKKARYTKRSQVWRPAATRKPAAPPVRPSKPSEEEK